MKVTFEEIFEEEFEGMYRPRVAVKIDGHEVGPGDVFSRGVWFGGFVARLNMGKRMRLELRGSEIVVTGFRTVGLQTTPSADETLEVA